jgi:transcriptional regulator with XRE-family HTH domain
MKHYTLDHRAVVALREAAGLSQRQLAELVGIGGGTMSQLESGTNQPSAETAHRIADALGVDFAAITSGGRRDIAVAAPALREIAEAS